MNNRLSTTGPTFKEHPMSENQKPEADEVIDGPEVVAHTAEGEDEDGPLSKTCIGYYSDN